MKQTRCLKPYLYLLPSVSLALLFVFYPLVKNVIYSLCTVNRLGEIQFFSGFDNYRALFGKRDFFISLKNTVVLVLINVPVTVLITLLLGKISSIPHRHSAFSQTLLSIPMMISMAAIALIFKVFLNPSVGFVNAVFGIHYGGYEKKDTAMSAVLLLTVWMGIGFNYLLFLDAFRSIPGNILESARLDGAGCVRIFLAMEIPLIRPVAIYIICTNTLLALMTSGPIMIITRGGPSRATTTLVYLMYTSGYGSGNYSMAACISLVIWLISIVFSAGILHFDREKVQYT